MMSTAYKKIIFIDDDTELSRRYRSILKKKHLSKYFIHFENAKEGMEYLNNTHPNELPDYILLDLYMPVMDGFTFLKYVDKSTRLKGNIEIFVCSSSQDRNDRNKAMQYPFVSAYLEKPLSSDFIELLIEDTMESA